MPKLAAPELEALDRMARQIGTSLEEIRANRAARREDTARATAAPAQRSSAKFSLAAFIQTVKQIPDGKYALVGKDGATIHFFEVRAEGNRNWVYRLYGAPGDFRRERMSYAWMHAAATRIAADAKAAAILFGKKTKTCGRCSSPLTNEESRAFGLGPKCRQIF